jgi:transcriptional regulator GlxA family with amidase domain
MYLRFRAPLPTVPSETSLLFVSGAKLCAGGYSDRCFWMLLLVRRQVGGRRWVRCARPVIVPLPEQLRDAEGTRGSRPVCSSPGHHGCVP